MTRPTPAGLAAITVRYLTDEERAAALVLIRENEVIASERVRLSRSPLCSFTTETSRAATAKRMEKLRGNRGNR